MSKLRIESFTISADGYGAGQNQSLENPMGVGVAGLHAWAFPTRTFSRMFGKEDGETGVDEDYASRGFKNIGAWIMGRNMFAHSRGPWTDDGWQGWWGDNPPYHVPVYVLTKYPRKSLEMAGDNVFHFVTEGIEKALELANAAAKGKDIRLGGGTDTIRQYLKAGLVDEMHIAVSPIVVGKGENLFAGIDLPALGYEIAEKALSARAMHLVFKKKR